MTNIEIETLNAIKAAARKLVSQDIDWEQRRYELVKELLPAINKPTAEEMVETAIQVADATIAALRKKV